MTLRFQGTGEIMMSRPLISKLFSFGLIGLVNAVIDLAVFSLCYKVAGLSLVPSNVLAWMVAVSCSYIMNTTITFRAESGRVLRMKDYLSFAASGILGMITTTTTLVLLSQFMPVYGAKLASIVTGFIVNFSMSHFVVFRSKPHHDPSI